MRLTDGEVWVPESTRNATGEIRQTAEAILDAAEAVFSDLGFAGATTRAIAVEAGVNLALIHYHFGTKEQLFDAVFSRRSDQINALRRQQLAELMARPDRTLEAMLDCFLRPSIQIGRGANHGRYEYSRLLAHVAAGTDERSRRLTSRQYDGIARIFIAAMQQIVPGLSYPMAARGYLFAASISMSLMARTGRAETLSDGALREDDIDEVIAQAIRFIAPGIRNLAEPGQGTDHLNPGRTA